MEFKSFINPHEQHKFAEGDFKETVDVYEDIINAKTGKLETKKTKEENFYEKIQEMKDTQTLENILKRYNIDLNDQHITEISQEVVDMTNLPEDLIETYAITQKLKNLYESSTAEIKKKFGDFSEFLKSAQNGTMVSELQKMTKKKIEQQQVQQQPQVQQPVEGTIQKSEQLEQTQQQQQGGIRYE